MYFFLLLPGDLPIKLAQENTSRAEFRDERLDYKRDDINSKQTRRHDLVVDGWRKPVRERPGTRSRGSVDFVAEETKGKYDTHPPLCVIPALCIFSVRIQVWL